MSLTTLAALAAFTATAAFAQLLDTSQPRGAQTFRLSNREVCIVPKGIPGSKNSEVADKDHQALCGYEMHTNPALAICPKAFSTNPAVELYSVPTGYTKATFESRACFIAEKQRPGKKVAKFKQTVTCSYTPSILAYDQVSDWLDAGHVPEAVIRTMDVASHKAVVAAGKRTELAPYWKSFDRWYAAPSDSPIFSRDLAFIYGALSDNPGGEEFYGDFYGPKHPYEKGLEAFKQTQVFASLTNGRRLSEVLPKTLAGAAQTIQAMKDAADMILMDTVLAQQDRFGNVHKKPYWHYVEAGKVVAVAQKKLDPAAARAKGAVLVNELLLKDNDCGVAGEGRFKKDNKFGVDNTLKALKHFSPKTYRRIQKLDAAIKSGNAVKNHFENELLFTDADWTRFADNVSIFAGQLKRRCEAGEIVFDLDIEEHLGLKAPTALPALCAAQG